MPRKGTPSEFDFRLQRKYKSPETTHAMGTHGFKMGDRVKWTRKSGAKMEGPILGFEEKESGQVFATVCASVTGDELEVNVLELENAAAKDNAPTLEDKEIMGYILEEFQQAKPKSLEEVDAVAAKIADFIRQMNEGITITFISAKLGLIKEFLVNEKPRIVCQLNKFLVPNSKESIYQVKFIVDKKK